MTSKEKAKELLEKFDVKHQMVFSTKRATLPISMYDSQIKQCALIAVDEILQLRKGYFGCINPKNDESYWKEVKTELEKL